MKNQSNKKFAVSLPLACWLDICEEYHFKATECYRLAFSITRYSSGDERLRAKSWMKQAKKFEAVVMAIYKKIGLNPDMKHCKPTLPLSELTRKKT